MAGRSFAAAVALALLLPGLATPAGAQRPDASPAAEGAADLFVVVYRPGPAWQPGRPMREQGLLPHARYIRSLLEDGRLHAGGPFVGSDGGMMVLRAADMAEVRAILDADPAIASGIFTAEIEQWWLRFRQQEPLPPPLSPDPQAR